MKRSTEGVPSRDMRLVLSASLSQIDELCPKLLAELTDNNTGKPMRGRTFFFELMLREALDNAIIHGCNSDPTRRVNIAARITDNRVKICISDHGEGFDWQSKMAEIHNPLSTSGLGIPIMLKYSSRLSYNRRGNRLILEQQLAGGSNHDQKTEH